METVKVSIIYNECSNLYTVTCNRGKCTLCYFSQGAWDKQWHFYPSIGTTNKVSIMSVNGFPLEYLKTLCKSVWFLSFGARELPEIELTHSSKKLLKIKQ